MSFDALATCVNVNEIRPVSKLVLLILANYANENWQSYPSQNKLAELCNCDKQTIKRAIKELIEKNIIKSESRFIANKQTSNLYTIIYRGIKNIGVGGSNLYPKPIRIIQKEILTHNIMNTKKRSKNEYELEFEKFWKLYPVNEDGKKSGKYECYLSWKKCPDKNILEKCVINYSREKQNKFIHNASRWILKKHYLDYQKEKIIYNSKNNLAG